MGPLEKRADKYYENTCRTVSMLKPWYLRNIDEIYETWFSRKFVSWTKIVIMMVKMCTLYSLQSTQSRCSLENKFWKHSCSSCVFEWFLLTIKTHHINFHYIMDITHYSMFKPMNDCDFAVLFLMLIFR